MYKYNATDIVYRNVRPSGQQYIHGVYIKSLNQTVYFSTLKLDIAVEALEHHTWLSMKIILRV